MKTDADRPDVDTLVARGRAVLDRLSDDAHCTCGRVYTCDWCVEQEGKEILSDLAARARDARNMMYEANAKWEAMWLAEQEAKEAAEADRDAWKVETLHWQSEAERFARRVTELEAALERIADGDGNLYRGPLAEIARAALAGDGGGAEKPVHDFPPDYTGWRPIRGGDGGGA